MVSAIFVMKPLKLILKACTTQSHLDWFISKALMWSIEANIITLCHCHCPVIMGLAEYLCLLILCWFLYIMYSITSGNQGLSDSHADHREGHRCEEIYEKPHWFYLYRHWCEQHLKDTYTYTKSSPGCTPWTPFSPPLWGRSPSPPAPAHWQTDNHHL